MNEAAVDSVFTTQLETIPTFPYLLAAYVAFFLIVFGFVLSVHIRQRGLERELRALESRAAEGPRRDG